MFSRSFLSFRVYNTAGISLNTQHNIQVMKIIHFQYVLKIVSFSIPTPSDLKLKIYFSFEANA